MENETDIRAELRFRKLRNSMYTGVLEYSQSVCKLLFNLRIILNLIFTLIYNDLLNLIFTLIYNDLLNLIFTLIYNYLLNLIFTLIYNDLLNLIFTLIYDYLLNLLFTLIYKYLLNLIFTLIYNYLQHWGSFVCCLLTLECFFHTILTHSKATCI